MRLDHEHAMAIKLLLTDALGQNTKVWLFGSRVAMINGAVILICMWTQASPAD